MSAAEEIPLITFTEFLTGEREGQRRHEYVGGRVYVMAGGTERHDVVTGAVYARLRTGALRSGCRPSSPTASSGSGTPPTTPTW